MLFKQNSLQRKLRFLISIQLSTCESLSFEFELLPQIYKMQCCEASFKLKLAIAPIYKKTAKVIYYIYGNMVVLQPVIKRDSIR